MATAKKPPNPLEAEANDESVEFEFRGVKLTAPMGDAYPIEAIEAYEENKMVSFVKVMLGPAQMSKVSKELKTLKDLRELAEAMTAAQDTSLGE